VPNTSSRVGGTSTPGSYATGAASGLAAQAGDAGSVRARYSAATKKLDPKDGEGRAALKASAREETPPLLKGVIEANRPGLGAVAGSGGTANQSSAFVDSLGKGLRIAGPVAITIGLRLDAASIFHAPDPFRELAGRSGALLGGSLGGLGGAAAGTFIAPGPGTVVGGVGGALGGAKLGETGGYALYDNVFR